MSDNQNTNQPNEKPEVKEAEATLDNIQATIEELRVSLKEKDEVIKNLRRTIVNQHDENAYSWGKVAFIAGASILAYKGISRLFEKPIKIEVESNSSFF